MSNEIITVKEVATYLRISIPTAYKLVHSGEIPSLKVGGRYLVPREEFRIWVKRNTIGGENLNV